MRADHLTRAFEKWWPELQEKISAIPDAEPKDGEINKPRSQEDLLEEILGMLRRQERRSVGIPVPASALRSRIRIEPARSRVSLDQLPAETLNSILEICNDADLEIKRLTTDEQSNLEVTWENKRGKQGSVSLAEQEWRNRANLTEALRRGMNKWLIEQSFINTVAQQ